MKFKNIFLILTLVSLWTCSKNNIEFEVINVATPQVMSKVAFRSSIEILSPKNIENAGKIYVYNNYIFVNDKYNGLHIIDNSNSSNPYKIAYIKIPGNIDISIKNDYLYADSYIDLLVFNISDISNISVAERLEDVFTIYDYQIPIEAQEVNFNNVDYETQVIVGWNVSQELREVRNDDINIQTLESGIASDIGTGGSLARFQIVDNYLYTVGDYEMSIFNISNLGQPILENTQNAGWNIETMFKADGYLYLGSTNGMYIYSLENPSNPNFVSEFTHWEGCDPVIVDGDFAYVTLRGGNLCGQDESILEVIDISDKSNPNSVARYVLDNPYGLGFKDNLLFVCDGSSGLKVFDKTNPLEVELLTQYQNIKSKDVIPLDNVLIMIGDKMIYQYEYVNQGIQLISSYQLN